MSKKNILAGWVHRLEDGILKSYGPGDIAPEWVTNPKVLNTAQPTHVKPDDTPPAADSDTDDDLDALDGKALKAIATELGVAKNGSLDAIRDRIRAKRDESEPDDEDAEHAALIEKAHERGIEVDENMTDVELQVLIEGA